MEAWVIFGTNYPETTYYPPGPPSPADSTSSRDSWSRRVPKLPSFTAFLALVFAWRSSGLRRLDERVLEDVQLVRRAGVRPVDDHLEPSRSRQGDPFLQ